MNRERFKGIVTGMAIMLVFVFAFISNDSLAATMRKSIDVLYSDIKVVIDGVRITPRDGKGEEVEPFIYKGTTYLPVRAISEGLGEQVNWDQQTKTVYIGEKPRVTYNSCGPEEFLERHKPYTGSSFTVREAGTLQIREKDYNYFNTIADGNGKYLVNGNYTKIRGTFMCGDHSSRSQPYFVISGEDKEIFNSSDYLESLGYKNGSIPRGDKDQPIEFEVDITGVEELTIITGFTETYNIEFVGIGD